MKNIYKLLSLLAVLALLLTACATKPQQSDEDRLAGLDISVPGDGDTTTLPPTVVTDEQGSTVTVITDTTATQGTTRQPTVVTNEQGSTVTVLTDTTATQGTTRPTGGTAGSGTTARPTAKPSTQGSGSGTTAKPNCTHADGDDNGVCDRCHGSVMVTVDFYNVNDLHGKIADGNDNVGVDELTTWLKQQRKTDDHALFLSSGDMWQGSSESNLTQGLLTTDWMNSLDFSAMVLGNHEYDWGRDPIVKNQQQAEFPILGINIYDRATNKRVSYCDASTVVDLGAVQIGIIGAMGDCYSSIAPDKCSDVYFVTGASLTNLVRTESQRLRQSGVDYIVYIFHDGYGQSQYGSTTNIASGQIASYYDTVLSNGYVDLVFEGHTHQQYILKDNYGVYHLQNRGDNKGGVSHVEVSINAVTGTDKVNEAKLVSTTTYSSLADDPIVENLLNKYKDQIGDANGVLGRNRTYRDYDAIAQLAADMYYQVGMETWGKKYDIACGGGFMSVRSPYNLPAGNVTYAQLMNLLPFDNQIVLCSVKGRNLRDKFFFTNNDRYYITYGSYGQQIKNNIDPNATYYVVTDTYTSQYKYNQLTEIARLDETTFARDLLAEYIKKGGLE